MVKYTDGDPLLHTAPITIWGIQQRKKKSRNPRPRCPLCKKPTYKAKIDRGSPKKQPESRPKRGRPRKKRNEGRNRHEVIGYWCDRCGLFFYLNRTPNYKMRPLRANE